MKLNERTLLKVAAFLVDRADQYETDSPCWIALTDAAQEIANGAFSDRVAHGELDDKDLAERVARWRDRSRERRHIDPTLGVEP